MELPKCRREFNIDLKSLRSKMGATVGRYGWLSLVAAGNSEIGQIHQHSFKFALG